VTNTTRPPEAHALANLRNVRGDLLYARLAALHTQLWLVCARAAKGDGAHDADARVKRAGELCELIADAVAHTERLIFFVEGDSADDTSS
jgi:hypothetical protein